MRRLVRPPEPAVLGAGRAMWTARLVASEPPRRFTWPVESGRSLREHLLPSLREMTHGHCAYCDGFPLDTVAIDTIDHFRPKAGWPELAFTWANLYLACSRCQQRVDAFDEALLAPDAEDHEFERYFVYNEDSGELAPNPAASAEDRHRATVTIELFGLNREGRPADRRRTLLRFRRLRAAERDEELYDYPYVYLLLLEE